MSVRRKLLDRFRDGIGDIRGHRPSVLRHRLGRLGDDLHDDLLRVRAHVRRAARQHLVQHRAERVNIGPGRDFLLGGRLLGTHVVRCAQGQTRFRHASASGGAHGKRDAEIRYHRTPIVQQDVLRLDVPMDDPVPVRVVERVGHLHRDAHRLVHAHLRFSIQLAAQRLALDVGHDVEQEAVRGARIEQRQDVWMLERRRGPDFDHESLGTKHGGELRLEDLQGDLAIVPEIACEIHGGHAALAELPFDRIATVEGGVKALHGSVHVQTPWSVFVT